MVILFSQCSQNHLERTENYCAISRLLNWKALNRSFVSFQFIGMIRDNEESNFCKRKMIVINLVLIRLMFWDHFIHAGLSFKSGEKENMSLDSHPTKNTKWCSMINLTLYVMNFPDTMQKRCWTQPNPRSKPDPKRMIIFLREVEFCFGAGLRTNLRSEDRLACQFVQQIRIVGQFVKPLAETLIIGAKLFVQIWPALQYLNIAFNLRLSMMNCFGNWNKYSFIN